jgi:hypothetical protein
VLEELLQTKAVCNDESQIIIETVVAGEVSRPPKEKLSSVEIKSYTMPKREAIQKQF